MLSTIISTKKYDFFAILPYPKKITVNSYWKTGKNGLYSNPYIKTFKALVCNAVKDSISYRNVSFGKEKIGVAINVYPPDDRIRDIDNILKATLDALQFAQVYENDSQIIQLYVEKLDKVKDGKLEIFINKLRIV